MHAWFAAAADTRYSVVVPIIGVQVGVFRYNSVGKRVYTVSMSLQFQGFRWAIVHDKWQARVDSIKAVFEGET